jgi:FtsP/CotA-like multicopper oxidase with cupredoxin domain
MPRKTLKKAKHARRPITLTSETLEQRIALSSTTGNIGDETGQELLRPQLKAVATINVHPWIWGAAPVTLGLSDLAVASEGSGAQSYVVTGVADGVVEKKVGETWVNISQQPTSANPAELLTYLSQRVIQQGDEIRWLREGSDGGRAFSIVGWDGGSLVSPTASEIDLEKARHSTNYVVGALYPTLPGTNTPNVITSSSLELQQRDDGTWNVVTRDDSLEAVPASQAKPSLETTLNITTDAVTIGNVEEYIKYLALATDFQFGFQDPVQDETRLGDYIKLSAFKNPRTSEHEKAWLPETATTTSNIYGRIFNTDLDVFYRQSLARSIQALEFIGYQGFMTKYAHADGEWTLEDDHAQSLGLAAGTKVDFTELPVRGDIAIEAIKRELAIVLYDDLQNPQKLGVVGRAITEQDVRDYLSGLKKTIDGVDVYFLNDPYAYSEGKYINRWKAFYEANKGSISGTIESNYDAEGLADQISKLANMLAASEASDAERNSWFPRLLYSYGQPTSDGGNLATVPGPVLFVTPGDDVNITFNNRLEIPALTGMEITDAEGNVVELAQEEIDRLATLVKNQTYGHSGSDGLAGTTSTNFHLHGSHTYPGGFGDNVVARYTSGQSWTTDLPLPFDHGQGSYWYHPHFHPSVNQQVYAGLSGFMQIGDPLNKTPGLQGVPRNLAVLKSVDLELSADNQTLKLGAYDNWGTATNRLSMFTVNGVFQPAAELGVGGWQSLTISNQTQQAPFSIGLQHTDANGNKQNLPFFIYGEDGHQYPMPISSSDAGVLGFDKKGNRYARAGDENIVFVTPGKRLDVLVWLPSGTTELVNMRKFTIGTSVYNISTTGAYPELSSDNVSTLANLRTPGEQIASGPLAVFSVAAAPQKPADMFLDLMEKYVGEGVVTAARRTTDADIEALGVGLPPTSQEILPVTHSTDYDSTAIPAADLFAQDEVGSDVWLPAREREFTWTRGTIVGPRAEYDIATQHLLATYDGIAENKNFKAVLKAADLATVLAGNERYSEITGEYPDLQIAPEEVQAEIAKIYISTVLQNDPEYIADLAAYTDLNAFPVARYNAAISEVYGRAAAGLHASSFLKKWEGQWQRLPIGPGADYDADVHKEIEDWLGYENPFFLNDHSFPSGALNIVQLGTVEEWTHWNYSITQFSDPVVKGTAARFEPEKYIAHPFHIHINDYQVEASDNEADSMVSVTVTVEGTDEIWQGKLSLEDVTALNSSGMISFQSEEENNPDKYYIVQPIAGDFRLVPVALDAVGKKEAATWGANSTVVKMLYQDFTGAYVFHCHILPHEDAGMMLAVLVVDNTRDSFLVSQDLVSAADAEASEITLYKADTLQPIKLELNLPAGVAAGRADVGVLNDPVQKDFVQDVVVSSTDGVIRVYDGKPLLEYGESVQMGEVKAFPANDAGFSPWAFYKDVTGDNQVNITAAGFTAIGAGGEVSLSDLRVKTYSSEDHGDTWSATWIIDLASELLASATDMVAPRAGLTVDDVSLSIGDYNLDNFSDIAIAYRTETGVRVAIADGAMIALGLQEFKRELAANPDLTHLDVVGGFFPDLNWLADAHVMDAVLGSSEEIGLSSGFNQYGQGALENLLLTVRGQEKSQLYTFQLQAGHFIATSNPGDLLNAGLPMDSAMAGMSGHEMHMGPAYRTTAHVQDLASGFKLNLVEEKELAVPAGERVSVTPVFAGARGNGGLFVQAASDISPQLLFAQGLTATLDVLGTPRDFSVGVEDDGSALQESRQQLVIDVAAANAVSAERLAGVTGETVPKDRLAQEGLVSLLYQTYFGKFPQPSETAEWVARLAAADAATSLEAFVHEFLEQATAGLKIWTESMVRELAVTRLQTQEAPEDIGPASPADIAKIRNFGHGAELPRIDLTNADGYDSTITASQAIQSHYGDTFDKLTAYEIVGTTLANLLGRTVSHLEVNSYLELDVLREVVSDGDKRDLIPFAVLKVVAQTPSDTAHLALLAATSNWLNAQWATDANVTGSFSQALSVGKYGSQSLTEGFKVFGEMVDEKVKAELDNNGEPALTMSAAERVFRELSTTWTEELNGVKLSQSGFF